MLTVSQDMPWWSLHARIVSAYTYMRGKRFAVLTHPHAAYMDVFA